MKIFLITDIHSGSGSDYQPSSTNEDNWKGYVKCFGNTLQIFWDTLTSIIEECGMVFNLGDLIHHESWEKDETAYLENEKVLKDFWKPVFHVAGNHDLIYITRERLAYIFQRPSLYYSFEKGGYTHIVLDGNRDGNIQWLPTITGQRYRFDEPQITWLKKTLSATNNKCIVYSHFPLDDQDLSSNYYWPVNPEERAFPLHYREVRKVLEDSGKVLAIFNGHTHFPCDSVVNWIPYYTLWSFSENNWQGKPTWEYGTINLNDGKLDFKHCRISVSD